MTYNSKIQPTTIWPKKKNKQPTKQGDKKTRLQHYFTNSLNQSLRIYQGRVQKLHTLLRMISGARYSGVPHNVQVLPFTRLAKPKSVTLKTEKHRSRMWVLWSSLEQQFLLVFFPCGRPECSRGGRWGGSQVSDLCIWGLVNGGTQMSALSGRRKSVRVVHCKWREASVSMSESKQNAEPPEFRGWQLSPEPSDSSQVREHLSSGNVLHHHVKVWIVLWSVERATAFTVAIREDWEFASNCKGIKTDCTLNAYSSLTRKGKLTACNILFSFNVCSICLSFTTWQIKRDKVTLPSRFHFRNRDNKKQERQLAGLFFFLHWGHKTRIGKSEMQTF